MLFLGCIAARIWKHINIFIYVCITADPPKSSHWTTECSVVCLKHSVHHRLYLYYA